MKFTLLAYPMALEEGFTCDTKQNISFSRKIKHANLAQWIAITLLAFMTSLSLVATLLDLLSMENSFISDFSIVQNFKPLIINDSNNNRMPLIDLMKLTFVVFGIAAHSVSCLESVPSWYTFSSMARSFNFSSCRFLQAPTSTSN